jgi:hypothetical protein
VSDDGKVKLRKHGALRDIRLAIMAPDALAMQWRDQLTATRR